jgi:hypothetical protein
VSLWTCLECRARYAVGLPACPQCASTEHSDDPNYTPVQAEPVAETPTAAPRGTKAAPTTAAAGTVPAPADTAAEGGVTP